MRVFTRIVELGGFSRAATSLGLPAASVTVLIKQLEAYLGVQLLQRTTRQVSPTLDGTAYYERCVRLLAEIEETEALFSTATDNPRGVLRVDMPAAVGRHIIIPALPAFSERYPLIELEIGLNDRPVDLIREGVDCVVRGGLALDDSLVARPLAQMLQVTCASPGYLQAYGEPRSLQELAGHLVIEYFSTQTGKRYGLEFQEGKEVREISLPRKISVNSADGYLAACMAGYGLVQTPYYHVIRDLARGTLCEVLSGWPPPTLALTALYPAHRHQSPRVRVFIDWLVQVCSRPETGLHGRLDS